VAIKKKFAVKDHQPVQHPNLRSLDLTEMLRRAASKALRGLGFKPHTAVGNFDSQWYLSAPSEPNSFGFKSAQLEYFGQELSDLTCEDLGIDRFKFISFIDTSRLERLGDLTNAIHTLLWEPES